jgi:hypothetical protein
MLLFLLSLVLAALIAVFGCFNIGRYGLGKSGNGVIRCEFCVKLNVLIVCGTLTFAMSLFVILLYQP